MRIATSTTHEVILEGAEVFDVQAPASYSGNIVTARISRIRIERNADLALSWRLFGYKVKRDGNESMTPFEYWPTVSDADGVWVQIPGEIRAQLPYSTEFARSFFAGR